MNHFDFILERGNAIVVDVMAKKVQLPDTKKASIRVDDYPTFGEVLFRSGTCDEEVVDACVGKGST